MGAGNKHNNKKPVIDGIKFDSVAEGNRYILLKRKERDGLIKNLRLQVKYPLCINGFKICDYIADFVYSFGGKEIVEDYKGMADKVFKLKYKLMYACHGIKVLLTREIKKQKDNRQFIAGYQTFELPLPKKVKK